MHALPLLRTVFLLMTGLLPVTVFAQADLTLSVSGVPADEIRGGNFTAQYSVHNQGPDDTSSNVVVTISLDNASIQTLTGGGTGTVNQTDDQNATVTYPSFPAGLTINNDVIIVTNSSGGDATVNISVSTGNDSDTSNNAYTATVTVPTRPEGDLNGTVLKDVNKNGEVDGEDTPMEGVEVSINTGSSRTTNAEGFFEWIDLFRRPYDVSVTLPDGYTLVSPATNPFSVNVEDGGVTTVTILLNDGNEPVPGRIAGFLTVDRSGTGTMLPMEGIRVYDDSNSNGQYDDGETFALTDAEGLYEFTGLTPGTTVLLRVDAPLWAVPVDPSPAEESVFVTNGLNALQDFSFRFSGSLSGILYRDNDANGVYDANTDDLAVEQIGDLEFIANGVYITNPDNVGDENAGEFEFAGLYPGIYGVNWPFRTDWEVSQQPANQTIDDDSPFATDLFYGIYERVDIRGDVFYDLNANGTREDNEPPAPGISIACTSTGDCQGQTDESDIQGVFLFSQVQPGTFTLDLTAPEGPSQIIAPAGAQFQFALKSGEDNRELQVAVRAPQNGIPYPDLIASISATPDFPAPGDEVTFSITVTNQGNAVALETATSVPLLATEFVSATTTQGGCNFVPASATVECTHLSIDPGNSVDVTLVVRTTLAGSLVAVATASTTSDEPFNTNNSATFDGEVTDPDISISLTESDHMTCTPEWEALPGFSGEGTTRTTTDGNNTRFSVRLFNAHPDREEVVTLTMTVDGEVYTAPVTVTLPPADEQTVSFTFDTRDKAWTEFGEPRTVPYQILYTVRRGEATLVDLPVPLEVLPRPLVLVHGLWSDASTWDSWEGYATNAHPGWAGRVFAVNTMDTGVSPETNYAIEAANFTTTSITDNADALEAFIADVREQTGSCHIELVAHSMGGLISRRFIHELMPEKEADGRRLMDDLFMLGTPNEGSPCTDQVLSAWATVREAQESFPPDDPAEILPLPPTNIIELSKPSVARFNELVTDKKGVYFQLLAGDPYRYTCLSPKRGDLLVEHSSAIASNFQGIVQAWNTFPLPHTSMTLTSSVFSDWLLPLLKPSDSAPASPLVTELPMSTSRSASSLSDDSYVEILATSLPVTGDGIDFTVGVADSLSLMIFAPPEASSRLLDADGTTVWEVEAGSDDATTLFRSTKVGATPAGEWRLEFEGSQGTASVSVYAQNAGFDLSATLGQPTDDLVPVTALVSGGGQPAVTAIARIAGSDPVLVALEANGDGTFEGVVPVGRAGTASITVEAQLDGEVRRVRDWVDIATVTDKESGEIPAVFRLADVFPNPMRGNGTLEVELPVDSELTVRLFDSLGRQVERVAQTHLPAGVHRVPLQIRAAAGVYLLVVDTRSGRHLRQVVITN